MTRKEQNFEEILKHFDDAMLTTRGEDDQLYSRPMRVANVTGGSDLWFVTDKESGKVDEIKANESVAITMQGSGRYLSVTGVAELIDDRATIHELWKEPWKVWFPLGKDDPSITLIKVHADSGAYWDISGVKRLLYLYEAGKAYFSGTVADVAGERFEGQVAL